MSVLHMLDTETAGYIIEARSPEIRSRLTRMEPSAICVSVVTRAELMYGLKRLPPEHKLHLAVRQFLKTHSLASLGQ